MSKKHYMMIGVALVVAFLIFHFIRQNNLILASQAPSPILG